MTYQKSASDASYQDLDGVEKRRVELQRRIDKTRTPQERNETGEFSTPIQLALQIAEEVRRIRGDAAPKIRFLEPALGLGSFYSAFLKVFPLSRWESAFGVEVDQQLAKGARALWKEYGIKVLQDDYTSIPPRLAVKSNLLASNPPYVRHQHLDRKEKERLSTRVKDELGIKISQLSGLYAYFVLISHTWLEEGGLAAWLIPSEFLYVNYGEALRVYLTEHISLLRIHQFNQAQVQFNDALVSSAVVIYRKERPTANHTAIFSKGGSFQKPVQAREVLVSSMSKLSKWNGEVFHSAIKKSEVTLSDLFAIKRGIATGDNSFFIMPRAIANYMGLPSQFLKPILPNPRSLDHSIVDTEDDGFPSLDHPQVVLDCDLNMAMIKEEFPKLWDYLERGVRTRVNKGYLASRRTPWYSQEKRDAAPYVCSYVGRVKQSAKPFRFFWNKSRALATNSFLMMYPRELLQDYLRRNPQNYQTLLDALNSIKADQMIEAGRVYGGGMYKLEPSELGNLPADDIIRKLGLSKISGTANPLS